MNSYQLKYHKICQISSLSLIGHIKNAMYLSVMCSDILVRIFFINRLKNKINEYGLKKTFT